MRPLKRLKGASTGTFSCLKVAMIVLLARSMLRFPAASATSASTSAAPLTISANDLFIESLLARSGPAPGQHAPERRVMIDEMMLERRRGVQQHHPQQRPGQEAMNLGQHFGQVAIRSEERRVGKEGR